MESIVGIGIAIIGLVFLGGVAFLLQGPQYVPTNDEDTKQIVNLALSYKPERVLDMGSGDGKLVIALAQVGLQATGIEINPWLVWRSRQKIKRLKLQEKAQIIHGSFWSYDISPYNLLVVFAIKHVMPRLEKKVQAELKPGARIISNFFVFPNLKIEVRKKGIVSYTIKEGPSLEGPL